jgi:transcriptional regulator with XRE-family HTH domain
VKSDLKDRVKELRRALGLTQKDVADASVGEDGKQILQREEVARVENGKNQGNAARVRRGLARGFYLSDMDFEAFVAGRSTLEHTIGLVLEGKVSRKACVPKQGDWPGWTEAENQARMAGNVGLLPRDFMGARLAEAQRTVVRGKVEVFMVIGCAWIFARTATQEELARADEAEANEAAARRLADGHDRLDRHPSPSPVEPSPPKPRKSKALAEPRRGR